MAIETPNIIIPREHQSAPKQHWADREIAKAAEEIASGHFVPAQSDDVLGIDVRRGEDLRNPKRATIGEFEKGMDEFNNSQALAQHPRVIEAIARMEKERDDAKGSQEILEKEAMLFEMNEMASRGNRWAGQERWMDPEAEERAKGEVMGTLRWFQQLERTLGPGRVFINRFAVNGRVGLLVEERSKPLLYMPGQQPQKQDDMVMVATLQWPMMTEWMVMRFDSYGVPVEPKYLGWRTALLSMIKLGVITEKEAHRAFPLGSGEAGAWYREQLFKFRSAKGMVQ